MISHYFQNMFARTICIAVISIWLLSACLGQVPTDERVPIPVTATPTNTSLPTRTPSPVVQELQVVNWRISSFVCDKKGTVENVTVQVTAEGGTLPYEYTMEGRVESNPPATKHVPPTDNQSTATPAKKTKNATPTPVAPTATLMPTLETTATLLPGQLLVNLQPGVEKIILRSADGQSTTLEVSIPSTCSDLNIVAPAYTPGSNLLPTSSPQPSPTVTPQSPNNLPRRPVCSDGLDNDGDGYVDLYDHNCKSKGDQDESH